MVDIVEGASSYLTLTSVVVSLFSNIFNFISLVICFLLDAIVFVELRNLTFF